MKLITVKCSECATEKPARQPNPGSPFKAKALLSKCEKCGIFTPHNVVAETDTTKLNYEQNSIR